MDVAFVVLGSASMRPHSVECGKTASRVELGWDDRASMRPHSVECGKDAAYITPPPGR